MVSLYGMKFRNVGFGLNFNSWWKDLFLKGFLSKQFKIVLANWSMGNLKSTTMDTVKGLYMI